MEMLVIFVSLSAANILQVETSDVATGGIKRLIETLRAWSREGHRITVVTTPTGGVLLQREGLHLRYYILKTLFTENFSHLGLGVVFDYFFRLLASFKLRGVVGKFKVISTTSCFLPDVWAAFLLHRSYPNAQVIVHLHHIFSTPVFLPSFQRGFAQFVFLLRTFLSWFQQRIALTIAERCGFNVFTYSSVIPDLPKSIGRTDVKEIKSGLDFFFINRAKPTDSFDAVFLGRICAKKGVYDLIEIWSRVCHKRQARLCMIGPVEDPNIFKAISDRGLADNIIVKGVVKELEKYELLKSSKLFLFPSYEEGWAIAVTEAMACGLAVVVYRLPAYRSFSDGIRMVPLGNRVLFADMCLQLLKDDHWREDLALKAQHMVSNLDWGSIALHELSLIKNLCPTDNTAYTLKE